MITIIIPWTVATVEKPLFIFTEERQRNKETERDEATENQLRSVLL